MGEFMTLKQLREALWKREIEITTYEFESEETIVSYAKGTGDVFIILRELGEKYGEFVEIVRENEKFIVHCTDLEFKTIEYIVKLVKKMVA